MNIQLFSPIKPPDYSQLELDYRIHMYESDALKERMVMTKTE